MPLPTLPTVLDELGVAASGSTLTSDQWNSALRYIEALSISEEVRRFPGGLIVGDDVNFMKLNAANGKIELGGTMRRTVTRRFKHIGGVGTGLSYQNGLYYRSFGDNADTYSIGVFDTDFAGIDLTENVTVVAQWMPLVAPVGTHIRVRVSVGTVDETGDLGDPATGVYVDYDLTGASHGQGVNTDLLVLDPVADEIVEMGQFGVTIRRDAVHLNDDLNVAVGFIERTGCWVEYTVKEITV